MSGIATVVVTFNRKELLAECLDALLSQTRAPDALYVVDNASTDGTGAYLSERGYLARAGLHFRKLSENLGGAAGFEAGMRSAFDDGWDWAWLMDDDAIPEPGALQTLAEAGLAEDCCYGSCAVFGEEDGDWLCWPAVGAGVGTERKFRVRRHDDLPDRLNIARMPFLGFMVSRKIAGRAGYPDGSYFVSGDDMDYSERVKKAGATLILVKASRIRHPRPNDYSVRFLGLSFFCLRMAPWRRYYDIRNRIVNGRRHYGWGFLFGTLPGILVRWAATLATEPRRRRQCVAYARGIYDGLLGRLGKRWEPGR